MVASLQNSFPSCLTSAPARWTFPPCLLLVWQFWKEVWQLLSKLPNLRACQVNISPFPPSNLQMESQRMLPVTFGTARQTEVGLSYSTISMASCRWRWSLEVTRSQVGPGLSAQGWWSPMTPTTLSIRTNSFLSGGFAVTLSSTLLTRSPFYPLAVDQGAATPFLKLRR